MSSSSTGVASADTREPPPEVSKQGEHALGAAAAAAAHDHHAPESRHESHSSEYDRPVEEAPPPPYTSEQYGQIDISQNGVEGGARVGRDGRVDIKIKEKSKRLTDILAPMLRQQYNMACKEAASEPDIPEGLGYGADGQPPPPMNIVIQIVGSRGDVQPFIALGKVLKQKFNHRVRIATHATFKGFVLEHGLEHFSIGGDPAELMAYMVKNPGLMPGIESIKAGDIGKRRKTIYEMINGCWRSAIEPGDGSNSSGEFSPLDSIENATRREHEHIIPFIADAIIANPVSFAHVHIAEKLGIPLHLMFTMPWSPTQAFPHPLANIISSNADQGFANYISYILVDLLTWQGLGDIINKFRHRVLHLEPCSILWAPGMLHRLRIPYTYCWSPALIPKPKDWGKKIDISGFFFLNLATNYTPEPDLAAFLAAGPPPVYIGFGSIVVDDPNAMTNMIFEAVKKTGQRALVSKGWGGLGADELGIPEGVFMLGNVPHDWLFKKVSCVVHHGGAGTTAAGIAAGRPTVVVPFFGDQPFWGAMTARAGAGPMPIPYKLLDADKLANAILEALKPQSLERAHELSDKIKAEQGAETGADSFHKQLGATKLRCSICPERVANWRVRRTDIRLSAFAATVLGNEGLLEFSDLKLYRSCEYEVEGGPPEPISGGAAALVGTISELSAGVVDVPAEILRAMSKQTKKPTDGADSPSSDLIVPTETRSSTRSSSTAPVSSSSHVGSDATGATDITPGAVANSTTLSQPTTVHASAMSTVMSSDGRVGGRSPAGSRSSSRVASPSRRRSLTPRGAEAKEITLDSIVGAGKAGGKIVSAGLRSPMDFTMSLAQGFHNAPKLYGDTTVRKQEKITDMQSGLKAAGKEFGLGFYDGITGLVTQPLRGAREEGATGFVKGVFKGAFGLVLKPGAAIWGLPGYTFKGIYMEITKQFGGSTHNYIIAARTAQGFEEWKKSTAAERNQVVSMWKSAKLDTKRGKQKYGKEKMNEIESHILVPTTSRNHTELASGFANTRRLTFEERKELDRRRQALKKEQQQQQQQEAEMSKKKNSILKHLRGISTSSVPQATASATTPVPAVDLSREFTSSSSSTLTNPEQRSSLLSANDEEFENAIKQSVTQTSQGDPQEDIMIERALRASVAALRGHPEPITDANENEAYEQAVKASIAEARYVHREQQQENSTGWLPESHAGYDDEAFERSLTRSLENNLGTKIQMNDYEHGVATDDDEDYQAAVAASMQHHERSEPSYVSRHRDVDQHKLGQAPEALRVDSQAQSSSGASQPRSMQHAEDDEDEELRRAINLSQEHDRQRMSALEKQQTEEEMVLEYVKKQSLLEEQQRQSRRA